MDDISEDISMAPEGEHADLLRVSGVMALDEVTNVPASYPRQGRRDVGLMQITRSNGCRACPLRSECTILDSSNTYQAQSDVSPGCTYVSDLQR